MVRQRWLKRGQGRRSRSNTHNQQKPPNKQQTKFPDRRWWKGETSSGSHGYLHIPGSHYVFSRKYQVQSIVGDYVTPAVSSTCFSLLHPTCWNVLLTTKKLQRHKSLFFSNLGRSCAKVVIVRQLDQNDRPGTIKQSKQTKQQTNNPKQQHQHQERTHKFLTNRWKGETSETGSRSHYLVAIDLYTKTPALTTSSASCS